MTTDQMRRALELLSMAEKLKKQFDTFILLKRDEPETILLGDPLLFKKDEWHRVRATIPDDARRYVFRLWRKDVAHKLNACIRELNQIGAEHKFKLIEFSALTGEPQS